MEKFSELKFADSETLEIIINVLGILKAETIVDWHKNNEVKRIITNKLDDYFYDYMSEKEHFIDEDKLKEILDIIMNLATNNNEIFEK